MSVRVPIPGKDIIKVISGDITFHLTPLTAGQRQNVTGMLTRKSGEILRDTFGLTREAVNLSLRDIEGIVDAEGNDLKIERVNGKITDAFYDILISIPRHTSVLQTAAVNLAANGPFDTLIDGEGKVVEDVQIILPGDDEKK